MLIVLRNLIRYMRPYKLLTTLFFGLLLLDLAFVSLAPLSFKVIIDRAIEPHDFGAFYLILAVLGIAGVIGVSSGIASDYVLARLSVNVQTDLRRELFAQLQRLHIGYFQRTRSGDLVSYFSSDLPTIERAMSAILTTGIQSLTVVVISTAVLFYLQWGMALCIAAGAALIFVGPYLLGRRAQTVSAAFREQGAAMLSEVQENAKAQRVIKGYQLQSAMIDKFNAQLKAMSAAGFVRNVMNARLERIPMVSLLLVNFTIIGLGSYLALRGHITIGSLIAFFTMYTSMGNSVFGLTFTIPVFADAQVSMERIDRVMNEPEEAIGGSAAPSFRDAPPAIEVNGVTFGYTANSPVLEEIDLSVPAGATAAFVGSSGSGKSTMIQLLLGFHEPDSGTIRLNGVGMDELDRGAYRQQLGIVFQDNFLFQGSLLDNIRMSKPDATPDEVMEAAKQAEIHETIMRLPDGYDTLVVDEGSNFSGGQRQRLAIARAILRNPPLLILDEATSALDPISEASINRTFRRLARDRTVVTVTHRLASVTEADRIFVFDQGRLAESGSHAELLKNGGFYKSLWDKQSGLSVSDGGQEAAIDGQRLGRIPFFRGVEAEVLTEITNLFNTETFAAGQTVIREGEDGEKFYLIARGRVEVTKASAETPDEPLRLAVLEDGDHFGEIALLANVPRTATVSALTPCVFLTLQRKVLYYILARHPEIDARVRQTLKERTG